ncbi:hypothetical protein [Legionella rubrilucens]|nr:hypothetical protein [Legionella rubrilucens]
MPDIQKPQSWWFSMEFLPDERLTAIDNRLLRHNLKDGRCPARQL